MKYFFCISCCTFIFFSFSKCTFALSAKDVVQKYCKLDYDGATLSSHNFNKISNLLDLEEIQDSGWDTVDIILNFDIVDNDRNDNTVSVKYDVIGTIEGSGEFIQKNILCIVDYILVKKNNVWKIQNRSYPRISVNTAIDHLSKLLSLEQDEKRAKVLKVSIKRLKKETIKIRSTPCTIQKCIRGKNEAG